MTKEYSAYLEHHGIKGQKWGVRRYQNADGTLTEKGRKHYEKKLEKDVRKNWYKAHNIMAKKSTEAYAEVNKKWEERGEANFDWENPGKKELKYVREIGKVHDKLLEDACQEIFGKNPAWNKTKVSMIPTAHEFDRLTEEIEESIRKQEEAKQAMARKRKNGRYDENGASFYRNGKPVAVIGFD